MYSNLAESIFIEKSLFGVKNDVDDNSLSRLLTFVHFIIVMSLGKYLRSHSIVFVSIAVQSKGRSRAMDEHSRPI